tara:strand:- start:8 stop:202 length:195 start_codon:yes stop_codon:yes gene_type:complete
LARGPRILTKVLRELARSKLAAYVTGYSTAQKGQRTTGPYCVCFPVEAGVLEEPSIARIYDILA